MSTGFIFIEGMLFLHKAIIGAVATGLSMIILTCLMWVSPLKCKNLTYINTYITLNYDWSY